MRLGRILVAWAALAALAILGVAQAQQNDSAVFSNQKDAKGKSQKDAKGKSKTDGKGKEQDDASVFGTKKLNLRGGSTTTKQTTTAAFAGVGEDGMLQQEVLATTPSASDLEAAKSLGKYVPSADDLKAFDKTGGLKQK